MVLKGLPVSYKPFAIHVALTDDAITFTDFKTKLRSFEETEKISTTESSNAVMKTQGKTGRRTAKTNTRDRHDDKDLVCFKCAIKGHQAKECRQKTWCSQRKSETHKDATCRHRGKDKEKQDGELQRTAPMTPRSR